ncbi:MAG: class I SAM-dependent methyltransferase, partial [Dehalococcoidia bacterium]
MEQNRAANLELDSASLLLGDDLGPEVENTALRDFLRSEILASGPITFRRFMDVVLYHPREGYYASPREKIGPAGDYLTSAEISPLFGYCLARQVAEFWRCLGSPSSFDLVEFGAGTGSLARDILRWTAARDPAFHAALKYLIVELSPTLRAVQADLLRRWLDAGTLRILPAENALEGEAIHGCILSNELLDSFPVHRVTVQQGRLREVYVGLEDGRLIERIDDISTPELDDYFNRLGLLPGEGCVAEVNLNAIAWIRAVATMLQRGYLLTLDYGYPAARLYAPWRRDGSLLCFHRHEASTDPYIRLGRQDMTAHVDFTSLIEAGHVAGLVDVGQIDQGRFLSNLVLGEAVQLSGGATPALEEFYARRRAVSGLLDPAGLGRVKVLLLAKNTGKC